MLVDSHKEGSLAYECAEGLVGVERYQAHYPDEEVPNLYIDFFNLEKISKFKKAILNFPLTSPFHNL